MSILLFLLVLFILVMVHEWGHFIVAKKTGMRVDEFGIGFPPKLWGKKKGETEYTFNALPIGGFVRIWGENGDEETEDLPADQRARAFGARPKWAQALVLVAGITMNIIFAWFLFTVVHLMGVPTPVDEQDAGPDAELYVVGVLPDSPAVNIPAGAMIRTLSSGVEQITHPTPTEFSKFVQATAGAPVTVEYQFSDEASQNVELTPVRGLLADDLGRYAVGVSLSLMEEDKKGIIAAVGAGLTDSWHGLVNITVGLWSLVSQAVVGQADFSQVAGPIGIVGMVGEAATFGLTALLTFTAFISLNLAIINLLPFPALDGGRLLFVAVEAVTRKRIPPVWAGRVNLVGFAILMLLMVAVTYNDILRLL